MEYMNRQQYDRKHARVFLRLRSAIFSSTVRDGAPLEDGRNKGDRALLFVGTVAAEAASESN